MDVFLHVVEDVSYSNVLREIPKSLLNPFKLLVETHHSSYQKLFDDDLKPKHHHLVHYASFILYSGTPRHQWAMRCEAKHQEAKEYVRTNKNKINICKSLGIKAMFKFAYNVVNFTFVVPDVDLN